jgi:cytochrome c553
MRHHCRRSHPRLSLLTGFVLAGVSLAGQSAKAAAPTFSKDVARILLLKCATCHRSGEVAPMSLLTYEATRPWTKAIKAKVLSREMPPWFADPSASVAMKNDRRLSQQEIDTITAWVDAGAPKGNDADAPPQPAFVEAPGSGDRDDV